MTSEKRKQILFEQTHTSKIEFQILKNASGVGNTTVIRAYTEYYALRNLIALMDLDDEFHEWMVNKERKEENDT